MKARLLGIDQSYGLIHCVDAEGMPVSAVTTAVNADERKQVPPLIDGTESKQENGADLLRNLEELPKTKDMILKS